LADKYIDAAKESGDEVRFLQLGALAFDPVLCDGYRNMPVMEPDLLKAQDDIIWAQHITLVFPIWWGGVPALMKGFFDRVFLPGFAFRYRSGKSFPDKLLMGRTAHLLITLDTPPWFFKWFYSMPGVHQVRKTTLGFCGIRSTKVELFGPVLGSSSARRANWLQRAQILASG
jgi:putative NADPH-quinone reductase